MNYENNMNEMDFMGKQESELMENYSDTEVTNLRTESFEPAPKVDEPNPDAGMGGNVGDAMLDYCNKPDNLNNHTCESTIDSHR